jgi:DNA (cytosine-5)-methyltransferase 1
VKRRRGNNQFQLLFSFDVEEHVAVVVEEAIGVATVADPEPLRASSPLWASIDKPRYSVPSMNEIAVIPWNGLSVVSTFSGCGGSCLGFKMAGYRVLWANEFVPAAQDTYRANHHGTHLDTSDIRLVTPESIRSVIGDVEIDVLEGSPPCASFSTAGKTSKGWGKVRKYSDVEQRTDDLFEQYIRLLDGLRPRAFVAENVAGMVKGVSKGFFKRYLKAFKKLPYNVEARLLDAQWLGVPQRRVRLIFVGVRKDVGRPAWPRKFPYRYTVLDAIPWIAGRSEDRVVEPESALGNAVGAEWDKLSPGEQSDRYISLILPSENEPCPTVTALGGTSAASVAHPYERRKFSIEELRRICGFPDDFSLTGSYSQKWERLGRSVPPPMMRAVAGALAPVLKEAR